MKKYKYDFAAIIIISLLFIVSYLLINNFYKTPGGKVLVIVDGKTETVLELNKNQTYTVENNGDTNIIVINNKEVWMKQANCKDKLCKKQGKISKNGESIICLPHKVVIKIVSNSESNVDAHTN